MKKDLVGKLTQMSVEYAKYMKSKSLKQISEVINTELKPLEQLVISCSNIDFFDERQTKGESIPIFRLDASKELFVRSLDEVCQILHFCKKIDRPLDTAVQAPKSVTQEMD